MSESRGAFLAYPRLSLAAFLQLAIWGSWAGALGGYASGVLGLKGYEIGWLYAAIPLGAVIGPMFIGPLADRYFSAQKVMSLLHFIGGLCLLGCGALCLAGLQSFHSLLILITISGICYMPTFGLLNAVIFKNLRNASSAPYVFLFGTIGWLVVNLFIAAFCGGAETPQFFLVGGGLGILLSLYSLMLPATPPQGASGGDALGLGALSLFKDPAFCIFALCVFFASIPACNYFFPSQVPFLSERGYPSPLALTTLNQFSEIFLMAALPICIGIFGLKWVLVIGMSAWALRYVLFSQAGLVVGGFEFSGFHFAVAGLLLHGFCYSFLYIAAYMYAEKKAPAALKASAQSLMVFLMLGVAQVAGSQMYGFLKDHELNQPKIAGIDIVRSLTSEEVLGCQQKYILPADAPTDFWSQVQIKDLKPLPQWHDAKMVDSEWRYLDLSKTVNEYLGIAKAETETVARHLGIDIDKNSDNLITSDEINTLGESLTYFGKEYTAEEIRNVLQNVPVEEGTSGITRDAYLAAQSSNWRNIFLIPAGMIGFFLVIFILFGRSPKEEKN